jgi:hypothetical protein
MTQLPAQAPHALAHAPIHPEKRTVVVYNVVGDPWPVIGAWAQKQRFLPREPQTGQVKLFQKGSGFWTAAMRAQFTYDGVGTMQLQAWIPISIFARIAALFMLPAEMHIRSGGFRAVLPRKIARNAINELLQQVGAPPIP